LIELEFFCAWSETRETHLASIIDYVNNVIHAMVLSKSSGGPSTLVH